MKTCGLTGLLLVIAGFALALFNFIFWQFIVRETGVTDVWDWVTAITGFLQMVCIYGAVAMACIGLLVARPKSG